MLQMHSEARPDPLHPIRLAIRPASGCQSWCLNERECMGKDCFGGFLLSEIGGDDLDEQPGPDNR